MSHEKQLNESVSTLDKIAIEIPLSLVCERVPPPPAGMNDVAADFWKKKAKDLKELGRLNTSMLETLATYVNLLSDMQKTREMMDGAWGTEMYFRYQRSYNEASKMQLYFARELGFTPLSMKNLPAVKKGKIDPLDTI